MSQDFEVVDPDLRCAAVCVRIEDEHVDVGLSRVNLSPPLRTESPNLPLQGQDGGVDLHELPEGRLGIRVAEEEGGERAAGAGVECTGEDDARHHL